MNLKMLGNFLMKQNEGESILYIHKYSLKRFHNKVY
mgnify:CR=1 FL=1